jgi:hypothetical protein
VITAVPGPLFYWAHSSETIKSLAAGLSSVAAQ